MFNNINVLVSACIHSANENANRSSKQCYCIF